MSKNQKASGITNIINYDNSGNISFVSGSTTLMSVSSSGAVLLTGTMSGGTADSASLSANSNLLQGTGSIGFATTASLLAVSSSQQQISSSQQQISASLLNVVANYATTGSNSFRANQSITGSLVVSSTITAQTLVVQTVTSSIVYSSGSNNFGNQLANTQTFTGSIYQTGSIAAFAGSVGIGTTNPSYLLDVRSSASSGAPIVGNFQTAGGDAQLYVSNGTVTTQLTADNTNSIAIVGSMTNHPLVIRTNNTERVRVSTAGVTTVKGDAGSLIQQAVTADSELYFQLWNSAGSRRGYIGYGATPTTTLDLWNAENGAIKFGTNNTEKVRITSAGYVGINNIDPLDRLDVAGNIRATVNTSYFTTFGYTGGTLIRMVTPIAETADNMVFKIEGASSGTSGNQFIFQTQVGNTTPVTTLWINKLGDVNIGTTTSTKYQVLNLINDANTLGAAIGLARSSGQFITNAGAGDLIIGNATNKNILFGNTGAGTTEYMRITSGGIVTKPLQPAFNAGKNTNSTVSAGATVIFQQTTGDKFNIGGHYNASTGIFTAPVAGVYIFSASIIWMNVPNGTAMDDSFWIYKNSDIVAYGLRRAEYESTYTGNGGYFVDFANVLLSLAVGDTVKVVNNRTLEIHGNRHYSYFYGYLLG